MSSSGPAARGHINSDHLDVVTLPFGISHLSCTLSPNLYKVFRQTEMSLHICLRHHGHIHKGLDKPFLKNDTEQITHRTSDIT